MELVVGSRRRVARFVGSLLTRLLVLLALFALFPLGATGCSGQSAAAVNNDASGLGMCPYGSVMCGGVCTDTASNNEHCGSCGAVCAPGETCTSGSCGLGCPAGFSICGGGCINTEGDARNCGVCGN